MDSDVLIYAHDISGGDKHARSRGLIERLWESGLGCLGVQVLQEFYVNVTEKAPKPLSSNVAAQIVSDLSAWQVHRPGVEDILEATRVQQRYQTVLGRHDRWQCHPIGLRDSLVGGLQSGASVRPSQGCYSLLISSRR